MKPITEVKEADSNNASKMKLNLDLTDVKNYASGEESFRSGKSTEKVRKTIKSTLRTANRRKSTLKKQYSIDP